MIDTSRIYCSVTGKPIGSVDDDELGLLVQTIPNFGLSGTFELERRCLLAARPSTLWMSVTLDSLAIIRVEAPKQLLAYLMNRLYAPIEHRPDDPMRLDKRLAMIRSRIDLWERINIVEFAPEQLAQLNLMLLELDSRFNLSKLSAPVSMPSPFSPDWTSPSVFSAFFESLMDWRERLVAEQLKAQRAAAASDWYWQHGSRLTRKAFAQAVIGTKPPTKASQKREAKVKDESFLDGMFDKLFEDSAPKTTGAKPVTQTAAKPKTSTVLLKFGFTQ